MAKSRKRKGSRSLNAAAETIGGALGHVGARVDRWKTQRDEIAADVQKLLRSAQAWLGDLGHAAGAGAAKPRGKGGRPKGYKMSDATKRKLRAAWRRRKAAKTTAS